MLKKLLPPLGTKIEPAGGIFLNSLQRAPNNSLELPREHPHGVGRDWFSYFHNHPGLLGEDFFNVVMHLCVKNTRWKSKYLKGAKCLCLTLLPAFLCEASPTAEQPNSSPVATRTLPEFSARNKPKAAPWALI